jgi:hypothetical protein
MDKPADEKYNNGEKKKHGKHSPTGKKLRPLVYHEDYKKS